MPRPAESAARLTSMDVMWSVAIGWFFGFMFGVGCALAVMYSIYMGGYRAAVKDSFAHPQPERWLRAAARLQR